MTDTLTMIEVTAACLRKHGAFLIARRRPGLRLAGLWEFPGGKIEAGETPEQCLKREMAEEFGVEVQVGPFLKSVDQTDESSTTVRLLFYEVQHVSGAFELNEHDALDWVTVEEMSAYDFAPADIPFAAWLSLSAR